MLKLNDIRCTQYDVRIKKIEVDAKCNELLKLINTTDGQKIFLDYQHTNDIIPPLGDINALSADGVASWSGSPPYVPPTWTFVALNIRTTASDIWMPREYIH